MDHSRPEGDASPPVSSPSVTTQDVSSSFDDGSDDNEVVEDEEAPKDLIKTKRPAKRQRRLSAFESTEGVMDPETGNVGMADTSKNTPKK